MSLRAGGGRMLASRAPMKQGARRHRYTRSHRPAQDLRIEGLPACQGWKDSSAQARTHAAGAGSGFRGVPRCCCSGDQASVNG